MTYKVELAFDEDYYDEGQRVIAWTKKNCPGYITNNGISYPTGALITFYFVKESESMWFRLKWADKVYED